MTKKCRQIQRLLDRFLRAELEATTRSMVETHLETCVECREAHAFQKALDTRLVGSGEAPESLRMRVEASLSNPAPRRIWLTQTFGDPTMEKILFSSTAIAAALVVSLLFVPTRAQGTTAKEKFVAMKSALAKAARDGELTVSATVSSSGLTSISASLDGTPLPSDLPVIVKTKDDGSFIDYTVTIDLSDANFSSIQLGKDPNTLNLVPKAKPGSLDIVQLDPKSGKPLDWSTFGVKQGVMQRMSNVAFNSSTKFNGGSSTTSNPSGSHQNKPSDDVITLHLRIGKANGTATMSIKGNS